MKQQNLVTMANQIADFFRFQGDEQSAMRSIAAHLSHFWAPSMRLELIQWLDEHEGEGMSPLVKTSVDAYRQQLTSRWMKVPGEEQLEQPRGGGDAG